MKSTGPLGSDLRDLDKDMHQGFIDHMSGKPTMFPEALNSKNNPEGLPLDPMLIWQACEHAGWKWRLQRLRLGIWRWAGGPPGQPYNVMGFVPTRPMPRSNTWGVLSNCTTWSDLPRHCFAVYIQVFLSSWEWLPGQHSQSKVSESNSCFVL